MFENTYYILLVLLAIVIISAIFVLYMRGRVDYGEDIFHKIWFLIRYAALKFEIGVGYGIMAIENLFQNKRREEAEKYPIETPRMKAIQGKETRIREMQELHLKQGKGKKDYNMKILD